MILDLNFNVKSLDGNEIKDQAGESVHLGKWFANQLYTSDLSEPLKVKSIAESLFKNGRVEIDRVDLVKVEEFVDNNKTFSVMVRAPLKDAILKAREKD